MRDILKIDKNKSKKLKGSRKRKQEELAATTSGQGFKIDTSDSRFSALLDGSDARFGIDKLDPRYKETPAMREIMDAQSHSRKSKKKTKIEESVADMVVGSESSGDVKCSGALALSSLVKSLKSKVKK